MLLFIGIFLTLAWTLWKDFPRLWKEKKFKEFWILTVITLSVCVLSTVKSLNINLPNPLDWIEIVLGPYPRAVYSLLQ
ncbi:hypothetical protein [Paenibacillus alba]|uniref:Uncharacterized protein n=1 Tax=Paenibacillus alba TaxID=1197127 RepID=A0ABU6GCF7_9BACL|nr:hypothetical protein [Paenibacillus alba]MEC0231893.1 hypothetical protein [Paenibacillus alba]